MASRQPPATYINATHAVLHPRIQAHTHTIHMHMNYTYTYKYTYTCTCTCVYIYTRIFARAPRALDSLTTHGLGHSPWAQRPKRASRRFLPLLSGNSVNIVIKNQWRNWTHRTAPDNLSFTKILDFNLQRPTVAGHTWQNHGHTDRHVSMTYDQW